MGTYTMYLRGISASYKLFNDALGGVMRSKVGLVPPTLPPSLLSRFFPADLRASFRSPGSTLPHWVASPAECRRTSRSSTIKWSCARPDPCLSSSPWLADPHPLFSPQEHQSVLQFDVRPSLDSPRPFLLTVASRDPLLSFSFQVFGTVGLVFYTFPLLGTLFAPMGLLYFLFAAFYRASSRECKRIDSILRSFICANASPPPPFAQL